MQRVAVIKSHRPTRLAWLTYNTLTTCCLPVNKVPVDGRMQSAVLNCPKRLVALQLKRKGATGVRQQPDR